MKYLDEVGLGYFWGKVKSAISAQISAKGVKAGCFFWFTGAVANIPSGYLVCNGQAVSRTAYADLFAVIGTKYGSGDGTTTFNLPDLSDGNGRFIRAGFTDQTIGVTQEDKIRNIKGIQYSITNSIASTINAGVYAQGSFGWIQDDVVKRNTSGEDTGGGISLAFDANAGYIDPNYGTNAFLTAYDNPMQGHADGNDIHPYNISMLPLIAY